MGTVSVITKDKKEAHDKGLNKTKENFFTKIAKAVAGKTEVDAEVLDNLEEVLLTSDVGVNTTLKIIDRIEARVAKDKYVGTAQLNAILKEEVAALLTENNSEDVSDFSPPADKKPYVIMVVVFIVMIKPPPSAKFFFQLSQNDKSVWLARPSRLRPPAV